MKMVSAACRVGVGAVLGFSVFFTVNTPAFSQNIDCGTFSRPFTDWGKTEPGFKATMKAGCYTMTWDGPTTDDVGSGSVSFKTVGNVDPWTSGYTLPGPQGGNYCQYRAAHEANGFATNLMQLPVGTEVTVSYRCE